MKSKAINKIIIMITLSICIIFTVIPTVNAAFSLEGMIKSGDRFVTKGDTGAEGSIKSADIKNTFAPISGTLMAIGSFVVVLMGVILGIRYMTASPGEQADVKAGLIPYVIGGIVVFGAFAIWAIVVNLLQNNMV